MSLLAQIKKDQLQARKDRDSVKAALLTTLIGEASMPGKNDGNRESTDEEVVATVKKFVKNTNELLKALHGEGGLAPTNVAASATASMELAILESYLPKQLTEAELTHIIASLKNEFTIADAKGMGKIMGALKERFGGTYDGALASKLVKAALQ